MNESLQQFNARRMAFLEGMEIGVFLLLQGRVSHAASSDGNLYTTQANNTPCRAHCDYSKTSKLLIMILKFSRKYSE